MGGVGAEMAKNIILGGVHSVTLLDSSTVSELDAAYQFLAPRDSIGKNVGFLTRINCVTGVI